MNPMTANPTATARHSWMYSKQSASTRLLHELSASPAPSFVGLVHLLTNCRQLEL